MTGRTNSDAECDRAFTRSDALAKHMRTVHETEALRPSDPVPKSMQGQAAKGSKLKIILKTQQSHAAGQDDAVEEGNQGEEVGADFFTPLAEQHGFSSKELGMDVGSLWKVCLAHVKWAAKEGEQLRRECREYEDTYRQEWLEKEVLLDQMAKVEEDWYQRRKAVLSGAADIKVSVAEGSQNGMEDSLPPASKGKNASMLAED